MSRSKRKPIIKDKPRNEKKTSLYWRKVRRVTKDSIRKANNLEEIEIPNPKTIVNDYDYSDYKFDLRFVEDDEIWNTNKHKRK